MFNLQMAGRWQNDAIAGSSFDRVECSGVRLKAKYYTCWSRRYILTGKVDEAYLISLALTLE